jgi:hypothetical protein
MRENDQLQYPSIYNTFSEAHFHIELDVTESRIKVEKCATIQGVLIRDGNVAIIQSELPPPKSPK